MMKESDLFKANFINPSIIKKKADEPISISEFNQIPTQPNKYKIITPENVELHVKTEKPRNDGKVSFQKIDLLTIKQENFRKLPTRRSRIHSNIWEFILNAKHKKHEKLSLFAKQLLFPHALATFYSLVVIAIQNYVDSICYLYPVCDCRNDPLIKFYTLVKCFITYYSLLSLLTFYIFFIRAELFRDKRIKIGYALLALAVISSMYMTYDGDTNSSPDFQIYVFVFILSPFFHILVLKKLNWDFRLFFRKTIPGALIMSMMFLQYTANTKWLPEFKLALDNWSSEQGLNMYMVFISFYSALYLFLFRMALIKFGVQVKTENYPNLNPIIFTSRICLCYTITIQISGLVSLDITKWGQWILLTQYCFFLVQFFSRFDPKVLIAKIIKNLFKLTINIPERSFIENEIGKLFTGTMIDFIFIFIPRLIILFTWNRWINFHLSDFYSSCKLEIAPSKRFNLDFLIFIIFITVGITLGTFCWMHKHHKTHIIGLTEKGNVFKQSYKIFLIHCLFELVLQDFQRAIQ